MNKFCRCLIPTTASLFFPVLAEDLSPWKRHVIDSGLSGADGVRLADVNGDGRMDIATGWEQSGIVKVYVHPGPEHVRTSWPSVIVGRVRSCEDAVFADLDQDGAIDVSSTEGHVRTFYVHWAPPERNDYLNSSLWKTEPIPVTAGLQQWMFALPMNVDRKNGTDLIVGSKGNGASVSWLKSPPNPRELSN